MTSVSTIPTRSPFATAWERAEAVGGFLSRREGQLLFGYASKLPEGAQIVEVGSYRGKSTALLASTGRSVLAIDPLVPGSGQDDNMKVATEDADSLRALCDEFENLTWLRKTSKATLIDDIPPIDFLFIDGDHQGTAPLDDFVHFRPKLKPNALVAFHDYQSQDGVNNAVAILEKSGVLKQVDLQGTMYIGRLSEGATTGTSVLLTIPYSGRIEDEALESAKKASNGELCGSVYIWKNKKSVLTSNFNDCMITFLMSKSRDYWLLQHADIQISDGTLDVMIRESITHNLDVLHAVVPFKNNSGLTSTAWAYERERWGLTRRLTMTELHALPQTFDLQTIKEQLDPDAEVLLPNTGVLLIKRAAWLESFPGFQTLDRVTRTSESTWTSEFVPEDWNFGYWCAENGVKVGGTRAVRACHLGQQWYPNDGVWGQAVDEEWKRRAGAA